MTTWIIEPHDPLIVRDGRPFGPNPGAQARSLPFPFPSTTTGGVRTRAGVNADGIFDTAKIETVKKIKVRGPLLVECSSLTTSRNVEQWMVPAPHDALLLPGESSTDRPQIRQLIPLAMQDDVATNLDPRLALVGMSSLDTRKPEKNPPHFWYWTMFATWLLHPEGLHINTTSELGHNGPQSERRIHVSIDANTLTGKDGALFGTSGLEFTQSKSQQLSSAKRLALAVIADNDIGDHMEGLTGFAGERRVVSWQKSDSELPACPEELITAIVEKKACRMILLTPAYFKAGSFPAWAGSNKNGVTTHLKAIALQRPHVVSGWDLEKGRPKPSRRLAPAGTVLFLSLEGTVDVIRAWVQDTWMQCVSDIPEDCNDGFGLAVLGTWSGQPEAMQEK